jgi:hypothetical protein
VRRQLLAAALVTSISVGAQETAPAPCHGVFDKPDRVAGILSAVPRYGSTYVLVIPDRLAEKIPGPTAPGVANLEVGVHADGEGADAARAIGIRHIHTYPPGSLLQPLRDIADSKLDAAVLWAPLAGLGITELGLDQGQVSLFAIDKPHNAPPSLRAARISDPCADVVLNALNVSGVLPAELLVPVSIRTFIGIPAPPFDLGRAHEGAPIFEENCARCHGSAAIADPKGLAPVDLRISIQRFSYAGFRYIVLNGRPSRSMPPLRGTVSNEQIDLIYLFLKARSLKMIPDPRKESTE